MCLSAATAIIGKRTPRVKGKTPDLVGAGQSTPSYCCSASYRYRGVTGRGVSGLPVRRILKDTVAIFAFSHIWLQSAMSMDSEMKSINLASSWPKTCDAAAQELEP
jgi:hypothetical protein